MPEQTEHAATRPETDFRYSPAAIARAQRVVGAEKPAQFNLPLFTVIAGLMAGHLIKAQRPPKSR